MRVKALRIQGFKRFDSVEIDFTNALTHEVSSRYLLLGDNGTGKTSVLQAIALTLGLAAKRVPSVQEFAWTGFLAGRYARWGKPRIDVWVTFSPEEIALTQHIAQEWYDIQPDENRRNFVLPGDSQEVHLWLEGERIRAESPQSLFQFRGRFYAMQLLKTRPQARDNFARLPGVFWFDQFRNLATNPNRNYNEEPRENTYEVGLGRLREYLNAWKLAQNNARAYKLDYLEQLEVAFQRVFPGKYFAGVEPMPGIDSPTGKDFYFLIGDKGHERAYDISEMSAGEQAIFPILYDIVRLQIAHSVVLIDEVDLNLHPPAAQLLVSQLHKLADDCQFILTTHSDAVSSMISEQETYRLAGGILCL